MAADTELIRLIEKQLEVIERHNETSIKVEKAITTLNLKLDNGPFKMMDEKITETKRMTLKNLLASIGLLIPLVIIVIQLFYLLGEKTA